MISSTRRYIKIVRESHMLSYFLVDCVIGNFLDIRAKGSIKLF